MDKRIGAQLFTVREYCKTIEDFDKTCERLHNIGYKMMQVSAVGPTDGKLLKASADKHGLDVTVTHCRDPRYMDDLDGVIEYHKDLDCKIAGLGCMPNIDNFDENVMNDFIRNYGNVVAKLKDNGLTFGYHNHAVEFKKFKGKRIMDIIIEEMQSDNFKLIFDVYWATYAGLDPAKFIREHKGSIACVHFKDYTIFGMNEIRMAPVGEGNVEWDNVIDACNEAGVQYAYVEQDHCYGEDPFECMARSYEFLTKKGFN